MLCHVQIGMVMDKFESQFEDLDVQVQYQEGAMAADTAIAAPTDQVDLLMQRVADENGLEVAHEMGGKLSEQVPELSTTARESDKEDELLAQRLRALRPAT